MNKNTIKAIIFDYDGTIVNSEFLWLKIHPIAFKHFGFDLSLNQALQIRSAGKPLIDDLMFKWFKIPPEKFKEIDNYAWTLFRQDDYYKTGMMKENLVETLRFLKKNGYLIALASGSPDLELHNQLKKLKIDYYFDEILSTESVKCGKPEPDIYLYVCQKLGFKPNQCLAIEDSPNGVMSASKAGCHVIMIPDLTQPDKNLIENYKFEVCNNLLDLKNKIQ